MRPTMIVLAVGLLSAPLSLLGAPESPAAATDFLNVADTAVTQTEVNGHLLVPAPMPTVGPVPSTARRSVIRRREPSPTAGRKSRKAIGRSPRPMDQVSRRTLVSSI
jgi:hypothetical protein